MNSTIRFIGSREVVALFVYDLLRTSHDPSLSITITAQEKSGGYFVLIVTDTESEDILKSRVLEYSGLSLHI